VTEDLDPRGVEATIMLADSAQVADGKLFILGGGIHTIGPRPQPVAVAVRLEFPWDQGDRVHDWKLEVLDEDGMPVMMGERPLLVGGRLDLRRPEGWEAGSPLPVPLAVNFGALPVQPGNSYVLRLSVDETSDAGWDARLRVRPQQPEQA
jgi:hypothetical protein